MIRQITSDDVDAIRSLHERFAKFPLPNLVDKQYFCRKACEVDGKLVGFGLLRYTSEAIIVLDESLQRRVRVIAVEDLLRAGIFECQRHGVDEIHAFLTGDFSESFARILKEKFGFVDSTGIPLFLEL